MIVQQTRPDISGKTHIVLPECIKFPLGPRPTKRHIVPALERQTLCRSLRLLFLSRNKHIRAVASLKEAQRHQLWVKGHMSGCDRGLPYRRGSSGVANLGKYIYNAKSYVLVHSWFRKWAAADKRESRRHSWGRVGWGRGRRRRHQGPRRHKRRAEDLTVSITLSVI